MRKRQFIAGVGAFAAAGGAVLGTGASLSAEASRDFTVAVQGDSSAYVGLTDISGGDFVDGGSGSALTIDLGTDADGDGVNAGSSSGDAYTTIDPGFKLTNNGPSTVYAFVDHDGRAGTNVDVQFIADDTAANSGSGGDATSGDVISDTLSDGTTVNPIAFIDRETDPGTAINSGGTTRAVDQGAGYLAMGAGTSVDVVPQVVASDGASAGSVITEATVYAFGSSTPYGESGRFISGTTITGVPEGTGTSA